jgi:hypothetical protein
MNNSRLANCIAKAAEFLDENQLYNGEFRSYLANNEDMLGMNALVDSCTFVTSCVSYCVRFLDDPGLTVMKRAALEFLVKQMRPPGVWKYFSYGYPTPIDSDLDDTACASFLLKHIHPDIREGRNVDIILGNRNEDGLFFTWVRKMGDENDVDSVVNANVLLYLGERKETEAVSEYLNAIVADRREPESYYYYLDDFALYYAMSRAYFNGVASLGAAKDNVISRIAGRQRGDGSFGSELLTALGVCSLLSYSYDDLDVLGCGIESLLDSQRADGSWSRTAYYVGGPLPPEPHAGWCGSAELTTGFCLEALARFQALLALK